MDPESIRNGLKDVFGTFDDFCQQLSNSGGSLSRHGVIAPTTPVVQRTNPFVARPKTPPSSQSARLCIQKMSELVEDMPLQPPLPASFNRELNQDPSSSTRSAPEEDDLRKPKKRHRNPDSDSEYERDRRRPLHASRPGTSRAAQEDEALKELFGDDTAKAENHEKATSPDSGVHSNEGLDDVDISAMINVMSNLLPMLSPVTERPQDRDKIRKENAEKQARKDYERKKKEERKEKAIQEEKRKEEQEEKQKRETEERIKKDLEIQKRMEDLSKKSKRDDSLRKSEVKQTKQEGKEMKEDRRRREEPGNKTDTKDLVDQEKTRNQKEEKKLISIDEKTVLMNESRLIGSLSLKGLSSDKLLRLIDHGKNMIKVESKDSRPSSPFVVKNVERQRFEKEEKNLEEGNKKIAEMKLEAKVENKYISSPRSTNKKDFHCASNECIPTKPTLPTRTKDPDTLPGEAFNELARAKKRQADTNEDHIKRFFLYLESMVYFSMSAQCYTINDKNGRFLSIMRDTSKLLGAVTSRCLNNEHMSPLGQHFTSRLKALSCRAQAVLGYHIFNCRMSTALKAYSMIEKFDAQIVFHDSDEPTQSSPNDNATTESDPNANKMVTMPMEVFNCYKKQLQQLHGLMNSHKLWNDSVTYIARNSSEQLFFKSLESLCGVLTVMSPIDKMCIFVLTGVAWLRDEYDIETKRPQQPIPPRLKKF